MPHINLSPSLPGISAAFAFRPETAAPMRELAHILLFESGQTTSLSSRDRELIAAYVSSLNNCHFCQESHGAAAAHHAGGSDELVGAVCSSPQRADISPKLRALLAIASRVQADAKTVTSALSKLLVLRGQPISRSTIPCSSLLRFACTTATWMVWLHCSRMTHPCMRRWESTWPPRAIGPPPLAQRRLLLGRTSPPEHILRLTSSDLLSGTT